MMSVSYAVPHYFFIVPESSPQGYHQRYVPHYQTHIIRANGISVGLQVREPTGL